MRLPASLRAGLCALGLMVGASGVVWLFAREGSRRLALACMQVHGSAAMALLVVIGAVAALHAPVGWREHKNRVSGAIFSTALGVLLVTGALLYYLGDEGARSAASIVHWTIGCAAFILGGAHVWLGRRARER